MAPTTSNNPAKSLQQNRLRPTVAKTVVPAVPKSFGQRHPKQHQAVVHPEPQEEAATPPPPAVVDEPSPSPPTPQPQPAETNGVPKDEEPEKLEDKNESAPSSAIVTPATEADATESEMEQPREPETPAHEPVEEPQESASSETLSSGSRSTYQMPPPFVPAPQNQSHYPTLSSDTVRLPPNPNFNGQSPMHHAHPSAGGVRFGGYSESNNSSPAPPPSAGNVPPYPYPTQQQQPRVVSGRHGAQQSNGAHSYHMSNGFPPVPAPPGYYPQTEGMMNNAGPADTSARRQMLNFGYSPSSTPLNTEGSRFSVYDPQTPHSFQGSQSSVPSEQENGQTYYNQHQTAPMAVVNGSNGHIDDVRLYQLHGKAPAHNALPIPVDNLDGIVNYIQLQFGNSEFSDYELELRYGQNLSGRIAGHGLMFARSPALKARMIAAKHENPPRRVLVIESNDRFLRLEQFWHAVRRLYGGFLMDFPTVRSNLPPQQQRVDAFDSALAYAAAGHVLEIPPVIIRGIEIACSPDLIQWATIEKALDFALAGGLDAQWTQESSHQQPESPSTYGPSVNMLIRYAVDFLIEKFPPNFKLDNTVEDNTVNGRLPTVSEDRPSDQVRSKFDLMFGDFSPQETTSSADSVDTTLSKVLLNLPFHLLKYVLESRKFGNAQTWATLSLRTQALNTVVEEREKRRIKLYNNTQVSNEVRQQQHSTWQAVGWQEYVELHGGPDGIPMLARKWVDYLLPAHQN